MLVLRYFMYVGGALLALLLLCAAILPKPPVADSTIVSASDAPAIRIHSEQKWPERVVLDTNAPMPAPVKVVQAVPPAGPQSASAKARAREAFAQSPADGPKEQAVTDVTKPDPKPPVKRRIARARPAQQFYQQGFFGFPQSRMRVAQQPRFGFFW
jgi:hypothetical protein